MKAIWRAILNLLRELSGENAYERHLRHHNRNHSPEEWRRFLDQHLAQKYARAKCC